MCELAAGEVNWIVGCISAAAGAGFVFGMVGWLGDGSVLGAGAELGAAAVSAKATVSADEAKMLAINVIFAICRRFTLKTSRLNSLNNAEVAPLAIQQACFPVLVLVKNRCCLF
jgi:hypothetical protein